jgi:hypothetical protein
MGLRGPHGCASLVQRQGQALKTTFRFGTLGGSCCRGFVPPGGCSSLWLS